MWNRRSTEIYSHHLLKKVKSKSFEDNFFNNLNYLKNTWKGIRNLISMTKSAISVPNKLSQVDESITDPIRIADIFNNVFTIIRVQKLP